VAFKRPLKLHFLDGLVHYISLACPCSSSLVSIVSELSGQLEEVVVDDSTVPGDRERLDQLVLDCRMSLDYLQGYVTPEILNGIHIL